MELGKTFGTDKDKEANGIWYDMGEGASILVARYGNPHFNTEMNAARKPYRQQIIRGTLTEEQSEKLLIGVIAKTILLDWKGIEEKGKPIKYSTAKAIEYLAKFKDFREMVSSVSMELEHFKAEYVEAVEQD